MPLNLSPAGWLQFLEQKLETRWERMVVFDAYFEGDQRLAFATAKWQEAFGGLFATIADNWCPLVVDASVERLTVQGLRFGKKTDEADQAAWDIWQANNLDGQSSMVHTEAGKLGLAYWLVEPPAVAGDAPRITPEHPMQMIVACAAGNRQDRIAALKRWWDDDGYVYATLYLPQTIVKWRSVEKAKAGRRIQWTTRPDDPGGTNVLGVVPVIPMPNAPRMLGGGISDLRDVLPIQDALNKLLSDMLIGSEYQAFPQRVLLGQQVPKDPTTGAPLAGFSLQAAQSRLMVFESEKASITQFPAADLSTYVNSREHLIAGLTAKTRTPPHYIVGQVVNVSGDALTAAETGLVAKTRAKMPALGEGHEEMMRVAFLAIGDLERARTRDAETIWADPEVRSISQLSDSLLKLSQIGVPKRALWRKFGFTPQEIDRMIEEQQAEEAGATDLLDLATAAQHVANAYDKGIIGQVEARRLLGLNAPVPDDIAAPPPSPPPFPPADSGEPA